MTDEKPLEEKKKGLFSGLLGKLKSKEETSEDQDFENDPLAEPSLAKVSTLGLPKGIKRLWGTSLILVFLVCLEYGSEIALDYAFREYRWVIGTTNPWTSQLAFNTMATTLLAALGVMVSALKTGIYLVKN